MQNLNLIFNMINDYENLKRKIIMAIFSKKLLKENFASLKMVFISKCTHQHSEKAEKRRNKNKSKLCSP